jgi:hypothetical protein
VFKLLALELQGNPSKAGSQKTGAARILLHGTDKELENGSGAALSSMSQSYYEVKVMFLALRSHNMVIYCFSHS